MATSDVRPMGTEQGWRCANCGVVNPPAQRFCGNCGTAFHAAPPQQAVTPTPSSPAPGYPPPQAPGGFPMWGWITIGAAALVFVGVVIAILVTRTPEKQADVPATLPASVPAVEWPVPTVEPSPAATPDPAYETLAAQLPPEVIDCQAATSHDPLATTAALCVVADRTGIGAHFSLYASPEEAEAAYARYREEGNLTPDTGDCAAGTEGEQSWSGGGGAGRLMCGTIKESGLAAIYWSTDGFVINGQVTAGSVETSLADVYSAWQAISVYRSAT